MEIPNQEVRLSLSNFLLSRFTGKAEFEVKNLVEGIYRGLEQEDLESAIRNLRLLFAHIAYDSPTSSKLKYAQTKELLESSLTEAMEQIKVKRYYETEIGKGKKVWLLALALTQGQITYHAEPYKGVL